LLHRPSGFIAIVAFISIFTCDVVKVISYQTFVQITEGRKVSTMADEQNSWGLERAFESQSDEDRAKAELLWQMEEARESVSQTVAGIKETAARQSQQVEMSADAARWRERFRRWPGLCSFGAISFGVLVGYGLAYMFENKGRGRRKPFDADSEERYGSLNRSIKRVLIGNPQYRETTRSLEYKARDYSQQVSDAASTTQEYGQKIAEAAATAKDYVTDKVSVVGDKLKDLQNTDVREVANQAKDYARQNPGQAILISAASGIVVGSLLIIRGSSNIKRRREGAARQISTDEVSEIKRQRVSETIFETVSGVKDSVDDQYPLDREVTWGAGNEAWRQYLPEPGDGVGPQAASAGPQYKLIRAWIAELEDNPHVPLRVRCPYTLNFKVGQPDENNLLDSEKAVVPESEIPDEGLDTEWIVTSNTVRLADITDVTTVSTEQLEGTTVWLARFSLHIPKHEESVIRQLRIEPLQTQQVELDVRINVRGASYRQFKVELSVEDSGPGGIPTQTEAARITNQTTRAAARDLTLRPVRNWQKPPGILKLDFNDYDKEQIWIEGEMADGRSVGQYFLWPVKPDKLAGPIDNVRAMAELFRGEWDAAYLNNIDQNDLAARLQQLATQPDKFQLTDNADEEHQRSWEAVANSKELFKLADHGHFLYRTLFPNGSQLRSWLDELKPGWMLDIKWTNGPHIPWGLLYMGEQKPVRGEPIDATRFWGLRFRTGYMAHVLDRPYWRTLGSLDETWRGNCLYWGNQSGDEIAPEAQWQRSIWAGWKNQVFVPSLQPGSNPKDEFLNLLEEPAKKPMSLIYFYCQSEVGDGSKLELLFGSGPEEYDKVEQSDLSVSNLPDQPLVFANACTTSAANPYIANVLEEIFFAAGCRAYLGTESRVPVKLASRFASVFFYYFYRMIDPTPIAAGEAVWQARRFLWNQYHNIGGLFYAYINEYYLFMGQRDELDS
jgi:ElaB/YqjD/DUF883 family membrane-anchored ribosome-binding protein